jgi:hypothetical protein
LISRNRAGLIADNLQGDLLMSEGGRDRSKESGRERDGGAKHEGEAERAQHPLAQLHADPYRAVRIFRKIRERRAERRMAVAERESKVQPAGGSPLDAATRARLEPVVGADLSRAKIHTGAESSQAAEALDARAFTVGHHVHFGECQFQPGTKEGDRLLAHELTHTTQDEARVHRKKDRSGADGANDQQVSKPDDPAEKHADAVGDHAADALHGSTNANKRVQDRAPGEGASDADWTHYLTELNQFLRNQVGAEKGALQDMRAQREEHPIFGRISEAAGTIKGGLEAMDDVRQAVHDKKRYQPRYVDATVKLPDDGIWDQVLGQLTVAQSVIAAGKDIEGAKQQMKAAVQLFQTAHRRTFEYQSRVQGGAGAAASTLHGIQIGCDITLTILSAGIGVSGSILRFGVGGAFKLIGEQALKSGLWRTAAKAAAVGGGNALLQGTAEEGGSAAAGLGDFDVGKVLRQAGEAAVMNFLGVLVGGALSKVFTRTLGQILGAHMSPEALLALAEKYGVKGVIPPELFVTKGWQFFVGVVGDACTTTLMTGLQVVVEKARTGKAPTNEEFVKLVVEQMIQNGLLQIVMNAMTHGTAKAPKGQQESRAANHDSVPTVAEQERAAPVAKDQPHEPAAPNATAKDDGSTTKARISGAHETLELHGKTAEEMAPPLADFLARELSTDPKRLTVKPLSGGKSGAPVFKVQIDGHDLGVFKVFNDPAAAQNEVAMLRLLHSKHMKTYQPVGEKGQAPVEVNGNPKGGLLMDAAPGTSVEDQIKKVPTAGQAGHDESVVALESNVKLVARGMAEMHAAFATGAPESTARKKSDAQYIVSKFVGMKSKLPPQDHQAILDKLQSDIVPAFLKSPVPATAYHGDANAGNFIVDKDHSLKVIDVGTMKHSLDGAKGKSTGAADVGRFMQSVQVAAEGKLSAGEVARVQQSFLDAYFAASKIAPSDFEAGLKLFRSELEMAVINKALGEPEINAAVRRIGALLGVTITGKGGGK